MAEAQVALAVVLQKSSGKVCVVNQNHDSWSLPKGHVDPGETHKQAAIRETHEETGLNQLTFVKDLGTYQRYKIALGGGDDTSELKHITAFLFTTEQQELKPIDPANPEARWLSPDEVAPLLTHRKDKDFFESIRPQLSQLSQ